MMKLLKEGNHCWKPEGEVVRKHFGEKVGSAAAAPEEDEEDGGSAPEGGEGGFQASCLRSAP